jgi:hypothetical protein
MSRCAMASWSAEMVLVPYIRLSKEPWLIRFVERPDFANTSCFQTMIQK